MCGLTGRLEAENLVGIYASITGVDVDAVLAETLRPISAAYVALKDDAAAMDSVLITGAAKVSARAAPTLEAAYAALGLAR